MDTGTADDAPEGGGFPMPRMPVAREHATIHSTTASYDVPLTSAHSGISGSMYDKFKFEPLSAARTLGATVHGLVRTARSLEAAVAPPGLAEAEATSMALMGPTSASGKLSKLLQSRRGKGYATWKDTAARPACGCRVGRDGRFRLDDDHIHTLKIVFDYLDDDEQVRIGLTTVGIPPTRALLREVRGDGRGGRVDFSRFVDAVETITTREPIDVKGIREALRRFERDAAPPGELPGHVMRYVLAGIPNVFGTNLTEEDVDEIFRALGLDEESPVDALEFVRALTSGFVHMPREPSLSGTGGEPVNLAVTAPPTAGTLAGLWAPPAPRQ